MTTDLAAASSAWLASPWYFDATARQNAMLGILCDEPGPHLTRVLAKRLGVARPVITRACNIFAEHGMIERRGDPDDGRNCIIVPTDHGRATRAAMKDL